MRDYTNFHNMTPTQLLAEATQDEIDKIPMFQRKICDRIDDFIAHITDSGLSDNTISGRLTGVKSFYTKHRREIPPDTDYRRQNQGICKKENKSIPKKEDIRDILMHADELEKALVLVGVSSGLSCNEIINLKVSDFVKGYDEKTKITSFDLTRRKTGIDFITFISPEATSAVFEYIKFRDRWKTASESTTKQRMRQLLKQKINDDDGYLFITRNVPESYTQTQDDECRKLTQNAVSKIYSMLSENAQKSTPKGCYNIIRSHNMRKYFNSALLNAGKVDPIYIEIWMGHKALSNLPSYFRPDIEKQKLMYKACVSDITISKELDFTELEEYQIMQDTIKQLMNENTTYKMHEGELEQLKANAERLSEVLKASIKTTQEQFRIFENGSEALGLKNYFSEEQIERWKHEEHGYNKEEEETE